MPPMVVVIRAQVAIKPHLGADGYAMIVVSNLICGAHARLSRHMRLEQSGNHYRDLLFPRFATAAGSELNLFARPWTEMTMMR